MGNSGVFRNEGEGEREERPEKKTKDKRYKTQERL
jgi:hypothetical protein